MFGNNNSCLFIILILLVLTSCCNTGRGVGVPFGLPFNDGCCGG